MKFVSEEWDLGLVLDPNNNQRWVPLWNGWGWSAGEGAALEAGTKILLEAVTCHRWRFLLAEHLKDTMPYCMEFYHQTYGGN